MNYPMFGYRSDIDGLRAFAVLGVVFYHLGFDSFSGGFVGVDIFFVVSGYLITRKIIGDLEKGTFSFPSFYMSRVRRLFPALFFTLLVSLTVGVLLFLPEDLVALSEQVVWASLSASNIYFWIESGYFDTASELKPLLHTWSLSVEEQFYLLWPASLLMLYKSKHLKFIIGLIIISSLIMSEIHINLDASGAFYSLSSRAPELGVGALLALLRPNLQLSRSLVELIFLCGFVLAIGPFF